MPDCCEPPPEWRDRAWHHWLQRGDATYPEQHFWLPADHVASGRWRGWTPERAAELGYSYVGPLQTPDQVAVAITAAAAAEREACTAAVQLAAFRFMWGDSADPANPPTPGIPYAAERVADYQRLVDAIKAAIRARGP